MNARRPVSVVAATIIATLTAGCAVGGAAPESAQPVTSPGVATSTFLPVPSAAAPEDAANCAERAPGTDLAPGTYMLPFASIAGADRFPTLAFYFTVPATWRRVEIDGAVWNDSG